MPGVEPGGSYPAVQAIRLVILSIFLLHFFFCKSNHPLIAILSQ